VGTTGKIYGRPVKTESPHLTGKLSVRNPYLRNLRKIQLYYQFGQAYFNGIFKGDYQRFAG
jgi:hypothetical protein